MRDPASNNKFGGATEKAPNNFWVTHVPPCTRTHTQRTGETYGILGAGVRKEGVVISV